MPKVFNIKKDPFPKEAKYIGRGSPYGNKYVIGKHGNRKFVCDSYEADAMNDSEFLTMVRRELRGCDLVCYCAPLRCHGDFLLRIANDEDLYTIHT